MGQEVLMGRVCYYVIFSTSSSRGSLFHYRNGKISTRSDVEELVDSIKDRYGESVVVENWIILPREPKDD